MYYAPHTLQRLKKGELLYDEYGRPVRTPEGGWETVCPCRCDHNTTVDVRMEDGSYHKPRYKAVCDGNHPGINNGDTVRCIYPDGRVRGEGTVYDSHTLNYLPYAEVYFD